MSSSRPDRPAVPDTAIPPPVPDTRSPPPPSPRLAQAARSPGGARLGTVLVCDLVGSTQLVQRLGDGPAAALFQRHDRLARQLLHREGGREIDKSDGFLLLFERPIQAVRFALAYHAGLAELSATVGLEGKSPTGPEARAPDSPSRGRNGSGPLLRARVGIHLGEVVTRENPADAVARGAKPLEVEGLAKVIAARLMSLAEPSQTLLTQTACDVARRSAVGTEIDSERLHWRAHGRYALQGVAEPVEVFEVGLAGLSPLLAPAGSEKARRAGGPDLPGVLVLPFAALSEADETEFISDGLADEVITSLSSLDTLRVVSRSAAMQLKGTTKRPGDLARELAVEFVLEGAVRRLGDRLRITARLLLASEERQLWAERYQGLLDDLFEIEEEISRGVVAAMRLQLSAREEASLSERPIPDVRAYEYYLRAKQLIFTFRADALEQALEYLRQGLEILGDNPVLTSAMGYVYWQQFNIGLSSDPGLLDEARHCARRILAAHPESADGHRLLGLVEILAEGDPHDVVTHLRIALATDPNNTDALFWLSLIYGFVGRPDSASPLVDRLLRLDPLTPMYQFLPGYLAMLEGDFARARPAMARARELEPDNPMLALCHAQNLAMAGEREPAGERFAELARAAEGTFFGGIAEAFIAALAGDREGLDAALGEQVREAARSDLQYSWILAQCYALAAQLDPALDWLENAVRQGCWNYPLLAEKDPLLEPLRGEARYRELAGRLREKWEGFEA